jgi:hypothetical protein
LPVRLQGRVAAILVFLSRAGAWCTPADVPVARRIAEHVGLALSHHGLAEQARQNEELRARTATLELLDELLAGRRFSRPAGSDRVSASAQGAATRWSSLSFCGPPPCKGLCKHRHGAKRFPRC